jgi:hypothetical protein
VSGPPEEEALPRGADREKARQALLDICSRVDFDSVARRMMDAYRAQIPGFAALPHDVAYGRMLDVTRRNLEIFPEWIRQEAPLRDEQLEYAREGARKDAREGLSLEDLLHAYRVGSLVSWQAYKEVAGEHEWAAQMLGTELGMQLGERLSTAITEAYLKQRDELASEEDDQFRAAFAALVEGGEPLDTEIAARLEKLGIEISARYRPFVASYGKGGASHAALARDLRMQKLLAVSEGDRVAGLGREQMEEGILGRKGLTYAIGESTEAAGLEPVLEDLRQLIHHALEASATGSVKPEDFFLERLLGGSPRVASLVEERVLRPLEEHDPRRGSELLDTLATFLRNGLERKRTAIELHVHPNTLDYRLRQIRKLTGLDPANAEDAALVTLALRQRGREDSNGA